MYLKNKDVRIYARISQKQYDFLNDIGKKYGYNTSEVIRLLIDCYSTSRGGQNENEQANINN